MVHPRAAATAVLTHASGDQVRAKAYPVEEDKVAPSDQVLVTCCGEAIMFATAPLLPHPVDL